MSDKPVLQELRETVGRTYNVGLGDVGGWVRGELALAGFWDGQEHRPRSFAGVVDAGGERLTWWEVLDHGETPAAGAA